jgi:hypothetical protein
MNSTTTLTDVVALPVDAVRAMVQALTALKPRPLPQKRPLHRV